MQTKSDSELLTEYTHLKREAAFSELVYRHTNLVYSCAVRLTGSPAVAAELTQQVFMSLARQSRVLADRTGKNGSVAGWLCRSARNLSLNHQRDEFRRNAREKEAMQELAHKEENAPEWPALSEALDEAMSELEDADYDAVIMRFYENLDLRAVGRALGVSDDAAQKRVARALDKLRIVLSRRGLSGTVVGISAVLSTQAVQAAPAGLAATISMTAATASATTSFSVAANTTKVIAMTTLQKAAVITAVTSAIGVAMYEARQAGKLREQAETAKIERIAATRQLQQLEQDYATTTNEMASLREAQEASFAANASASAELVKLGGEVARLRRALDDSSRPEFNGKLGVIYDLKRRFKEMRDKSIPEVEYMDDDAWLRLAQRPRFVFEAATATEESIRRALADVRREAKAQFAFRIQRALQSFTTDHQGELPSDMQQLQSYLNAQPDTQAARYGMPNARFGPDGKSLVAHYLPAVDDNILQRYEMMQTGNISNLRPAQYVVREKAPVDSEFDSLIQIGLAGYFTSGVGQHQEYIGWGGDQPDLAGLTPEEREAYKRTLDTRARTMENLRRGQPGNPPR